jgi:hypothetical protein
VLDRFLRFFKLALDMSLDERTLTFLKGGHIQSSVIIKEILFDERKNSPERNSRVVSPSWTQNVPYITCSILSGEVPLDDPKGELAFYMNVRNALIYGLVHGKIPDDKFGKVLRGAPREIIDLLSYEEGNSVDVRLE